VVRPAVRRIVLTGPECSGKTTLATQLAEELGAPLVPESARAFAEEVKRALVVDDVEQIARRHVAAEGSFLAASPTTLVLDTDLLSTVVYGRHYYGFRSEFIDREARARVGSLYLLCAPDLPWLPDGVRDRPEGREEMLAEFRAVLAEFGAPFVAITGAGAARLDAARRAITRG
jgi:NadR type nicotinamide-nucleotide adenylyltransferase